MANLAQPSRGRRPKWWQSRLMAEAARIQSTIQAAGLGESADSADAQIRKRILSNVNHALELLDQHLDVPWYRRRPFRDAQVNEVVLGQLQQAAEDSFLICSPDALLAQVPSLRGDVKTVLGPVDARTDDFVRYLDNLESRPGRPVLGGGIRPKTRLPWRRKP